MTGAVDIAFAHAVRAAAKGQGDALDKMLREGLTIGAGEIAMAAELDSGALRPVGGRGAALSPAQQRYYAARYLASGKNKQAMAAIVDATGMDRATVFGWVRILRAGLSSVPEATRDVILRRITDLESEHERKAVNPGE